MQLLQKVLRLKMPAISLAETQAGMQKARRRVPRPHCALGEPNQCISGPTTSQSIILQVFISKDYLQIWKFLVPWNLYHQMVSSS
jgi:hypothetical protein